ncbi:MAG: lytic transglycosylase domain-containing protein [candidate division KSB1 bacterium]|nr:lytic transglycosylase domain-containing protein [candidate division KSB1 bacterium]
MRMKLEGRMPGGMGRLLGRGIMFGSLAFGVIGALGFTVGYVRESELRTRIAQLEQTIRELRSTVNVDSERYATLRKIVAIIDKHNPEMPADLKYRIADEIYRLSLRFDNLTPDLLCAVITHETGGTWDPKVVSPAGAIGLMQIMPTTGMYIAEAEGISWTSAQDVLFDPILNLRIGARYLSDLIRNYGVEGALAAYNGGERSAVRWLASGKRGDLLQDETRAYVPRIVKLHEQYKSGQL